MKSWVTAFLIVALAIVGYLWYASGTGRNQMAQDIKNTPGQVENKVGQVTDKTGQLAEPAGDLTGKNAKTCNDCHKPGSQYSLSNEAKNIQGHPKVTSDDVASCMKCHANPDKSYAFQYVLHTGHLKEGSTFVTKYNGRCTTCHKMESNGRIVVAGMEK